MNNKIRLRVPCSSANLGPGFDTMAIALNRHNYIDLELIGSKTELIQIQGIDPAFKDMCLEMFKAASSHFHQRAGLEEIPFAIRFENHIPIARGLGSSATIRLAALHGLNQLRKTGVLSETIVQWASELEACSDNVAASFFGGMTASGIINNRLVYQRCDVPNDIDFVAVSPSTPVETDKARVFPDLIPRKDAIYTLSRGILLAMAFASRDYAAMENLFEDRLHQPYRQKSIPALNPLYEVIQAAQKAGALGGYLSGSGSTVMALTLKNREEVAQAMQNAFANYDMDSECRVMKADNQGIQIV
ncbi:MAG: homoserine kinase [Candidatus Omnitrophota bacterium]